MNAPITRAQRDVLVALHRHMTEHSICPSYEILGKAAGMKSRSQIWFLVKRLEDRGMVTSIPGKARSLSLTPAGLEVAVFASLLGPQPAEAKTWQRQLFIARAMAATNAAEINDAMIKLVASAAAHLNAQPYATQLTITVTAQSLKGA